MIDPIERQAAIDAIDHATFNIRFSGKRGFQNYKEEFEKACVAIKNKYIEALKSLPSAETEGKHGRWIKTIGYEHSATYPMYKCSICGHEELSVSFANYCPWCGKKMDEERRNDE